MHDSAATHTVVGINYYLEELARRDAAEQTAEIVKLNRSMAEGSAEMTRLTRRVTALTVIAAVLTAANLIAVIVE